MIIKFGKTARRVTPQDQAAIGRTQQEVGDFVLKNIVKQGVELAEGKSFVTRIARRAQEAALAEAHRLMDVVLAAMDQQRPNSSGLSYSDMARGAPKGTKGPPGRVDWKSLDDKYYWWKKAKYPSNANRMFRASDNLRNYLDARRGFVVDNRLGGVQITVSKQKTFDTNPTLVKQQLEHLKIGRITVTIFPKLSSALAPMLTTRRWADVAPHGKMEKMIFRGTKAANKLANGGGNNYRPLVAPTVQFFMIARIPAAIRKALQKYMKRMEV